MKISILVNEELFLMEVALRIFTKINENKGLGQVLIFIISIAKNLIAHRNPYYYQISSQEEIS